MADSTSLKTCNICKASKPRSEFYRSARARDGLQSRCRECAKAYSREWRRQNPDRVRAQNVAWYAANRERHRERVKVWRLRNPAADKAIMARYRDDPKRREVARLATREWRVANPDLVAEWLANNQDKVRAKSNRRRARKFAATVGDVDLNDLWVDCDGICPLCSEPIARDQKWPHPLSASLDHIVPLSKGGTHEQANLQWTHLVCNIRKGAHAP